METPPHEMVDPTPDRRRWWLQFFSILLGGLATLTAGIPIVGYLLAPARRPEDEGVFLCDTKAVPRGETRLVTYVNPKPRPGDGMTARVAAYVRHLDDGSFQVLGVNCTHLGCPVSWFAQAGLFLCPCHGGAYYADGAHASGPPPRGLFRYDVDAAKLAKGQIWVKAGHLPTLRDPLSPQDEQG